MDYDSMVIEFLAQGENLPFVLEIASKVEQVRDKLQLDFWKHLEARLDEKLNTSGLQSEWKLVLHDNILAKWSGMGIYPRKVARSYQMFVKLGQSSGDMHLFYGVHWNRPWKAPLTIKGLDDFIRKLRSQGYTDSSDWVPALRHTDICPRSNEFALRVVKDLDSLAITVGDMFWEFFDENAETIQSINRAISESTEYS